MSGNGTLMEFETREEMEKELQKETAAGSMAIPFPNRAINVGGEPYQAYVQSLPAVLSQADSMISSSLGALTTQAMNTVASNQITEVVGENAAINYMKQHYPGAQMFWGPAVHRGAGIDQIWWSRATDRTVTYYIVEAKGPGAKLQDDPFVAGGFGEQMSLPWVLHNLVTMTHSAKRTDLNEEQIAAYTGVLELMEAMGLTEESQTALGGASKKYNKCKYSGRQGRTKLVGIVATAYWADVGLNTFVPQPIDYSLELDLRFQGKTVEYLNGH